MLYMRSIRDISKGVSGATARFAWIHGYHMTQKLAMPVILTAILVTEKLDQELDQTEISPEF